jgi:hypothetical protein
VSDDAGSTEGARVAEQPPRPMIERLGLGLIALVLAVMFAALGYVSLTGGEVFLGIMGVIGALMTVWAAASSLRRG